MPQGQTASSVLNLFPLIFIFIIFYFLLIRPQRTKEKEHQKMLQNLNKNDEVVTSSGIHGTIVNVKDKTLIFATTNGSKAIVKGAVGLSLAVGSFVNFQTVEEHLNSNSNDLSIICSGKLDQFSIEDAVCGGLYIDALVNKDVRQLNDAAYVALKLYEIYKGNLLEMLKKSSHGRYLIELGFEKDLQLCSEVNSLQILPVLSDGRLVRGS